MAGYYGDYGAIEVNEAGESESEEFVSLMCSTGIRINKGREKARVDCQGSANKEYAVGKPDFQFSAEGRYSPTQTALFTAVDSNAAVPLRLTPYDDDGHIQYKGDFVLEQFEIDARQDQIIGLNLSGGAAGTVQQSTIPA